MIATTNPQAIVITSTPIWGNAPPADVLRAADADALITLMHVELIPVGVRSIIVDLFDSTRAEAFRQAIRFTTVPTASIFASVVTQLVIEPSANKPVSDLFADPKVRRISSAFRPPDGAARPFTAVHRALLERRQAALGVIGEDSVQLNPPANHPVKAGDRLLVFERMQGSPAA